MAWPRKRNCWRVKGLHESNPMMGLRGIRLSIVMPEIVEMQVRAIFEAAGDVDREASIRIRGHDPADRHFNELKYIQPQAGAYRQAGHGGEGHTASTTSSAP